MGPECDARESVAVHPAAGTKKELAIVAGALKTREQFGFGFFRVGLGFLPLTLQPATQSFLSLHFSLFHKATCWHMCSKRKTVSHPS